MEDEEASPIFSNTVDRLRLTAVAHQSFDRVFVDNFHLYTVGNSLGTLGKGEHPPMKVTAGEGDVEEVRGGQLKIKL